MVSERAVLAAVSHPVIVDMPAHFQDDHTLFILLQFLPGGELFRRIRTHGRA